MTFLLPPDQIAGSAPRSPLPRAVGVAVLWLMCAWLTHWVFAFMPNQSVYPIWPADAIALGFVLIWGYRVIAPLLGSIFIWNWGVMGHAVPFSLLGTLALGLGIVVAVGLRSVLQKVISSDYGRRLIGFPLTVFMLSSVITVVGVWKNPLWTAHYQTIGLFWLAESIALLAFTPLGMACLHEGCQPLIAQLSKTAQHYIWLGVWLALALLSLVVIAGLRHWAALDFNAPSLLGLVMVVLAAHSLPVLVARVLIAGYLSIWSVLNVLVNVRVGWESSQLLGDQALVFVAALLAVIAIEMVQAYRLSEQKLAQRLRTDPLTGLPNDLGLAKQLALWPKEANGEMQAMVVIGVHLPDLEEIDALMGHERSNRIEMQVGRIFESQGLRS